MTERVSRRATAHIENHALSRGLRLADALIAATAAESERALVTANAGHYRFLPGVAAERYRP